MLAGSGLVTPTTSWPSRHAPAPTSRSRHAWPGSRSGGSGTSWAEPRLDLRTEAATFAGELSDLLNHTVTHGIRINAVTDRWGQQARIGYRRSPQDVAHPARMRLTRGS